MLRSPFSARLVRSAITTFAPLRQESEIAIHQDNGIALGRLKTGREGGLVTEVPRKLHYRHAGIIALNVEQKGQRRIVAAIVHVNDLPALRNIFQYGQKGGVKRLDIFFFVIDRDYD